MRFAIASDDGVRIAAHTGRCRAFVIFDLAEDAPVYVEVRGNGFTAHARGLCDGDHESHAGGHGAEGAGGHSHGSLLEALADCGVLISRGMGPRLREDLQSRNIDALVTSEELVYEAAKRFAEGVLERVAGGGCQRHG